MPFLLDRKFVTDIIFSKQKNLFLAGVFLGINMIFFNYSLNYTGGGLFFQISNLIFENNYFFYLIAFFSLLVLFYLSSIDINNFLIFLILIISNIQNTIYHKYYDPLILILFFTLINSSLNFKFFKNKKNIIYIFIFYIIFILMRITKNYILN